MRKTLLNISFCLVGASAFAQVPPTPLDSIIPNDSIFFDNQMEEVVLIGYGSKKAGAITGSVAQVKAADIVRTPSQSPIQAIQGRAAGVNIVTNDEPGALPTIRIRGLGTITAGRDPLYVVDGVETTNITGLNPNDIATIDILKDASSLAIYGQKGANGVVLITTKRGKRGDIKVTYDGYYGQKFIQRDVDMAGSYRYAYYNNTALGSSSYFNLDSQPYNTNWLDAITRTGEMMNNTISISGASDNANYYLSASNYKERGILNGTAFERTSIVMKNEFRMLNDKLKVTPFINLSNANTTPKPLSAFTNAYRQAPIMPIRYPNGRWGAPLVNELGFNDLTGQRYNNVANPVAQLYYYNEERKNVLLTGSIKAELEILDYLTFTSNFGATAEWVRGYTFTPTRELWLAANPTGTIDEYIAQNAQNPIINRLDQRRSSNYRWNWDNFVTFSKYFDTHKVVAVAGYSRSTFGVWEYLNATRFDVPEQSNYWSLNLSSNNEEVAPGSVVQNETGTPIVNLAYFGRLEYEYNDKYLFTASVRRESISIFQGSKKNAVFPSVSAGWIISSEGFMDNVNFLNHLKIRGGYGEVGNANSIALNAVQFSNGNYAIGPDQSINPGLFNPGQIDRNLTWETMKEYDLGIDFAMLTNRLSGTIDVYDRKNEDLILPIDVPEVLSPDSVFLNSGVVSNKGVEVTLKWQDRIGEDINYWIGGNMSYNKNELEEIYNPQLFGDYIGGGLGNGQYTKQVLLGQPLGSFYVYETTGFNSDGAFTYSDQRVVAGTYIPTTTYGINLGLTYKGIDFSVDAYGVAGNKLYNGKKAQRFGGENIESALLDSFWTPSTPNATNPKPNNDVPRASTYYIENGDYLRINNITLGYTLPEMIKGVDKVRIYATAVNPFLFTDFSGFSPELSGSNNGDPLGNAGIELDAYPTNKSFLFGLNVAF
ncbi:SusC/RagA family TonB-linked outer membrane protein [Flavobacterium coralii]|uniref:SusC/RagA family TonB-linked outer membrane protein n=1 Tax=Flavobacterium coralii TaxID=2838017 RepID=UPI000C3D0995|nr:SusC/RagA family TonB-linked outer membrane protein [Flavobacterium sp.]|tara:strand:- start:50752 stop:53562 length:2811 start_codon:yes stop_codon:yes gene_type:complete